MASSEGDVVRVLEGVVDPALRHPLGKLGMIREVRARRRRTEIVLALPSPDYPSRDELGGRVREALARAGLLDDVELRIVEMTDTEKHVVRQLLVPARDTSGGSAAGRDEPSHTHAGGSHHGSRPNVFMQPGSETRVLGISSGKGGVGKSSVSVNLSIALARQGHEVAVLDADVYGFSVPKMLGIDRNPMMIEDILVPPRAHGITCMSIGYFVREDQPVIWRGPMLHKALEQFLVDVYWGEPRWLVIDMPPGTGDVALSMAEYLPRAEILVVTTPQAAAQRVAQRSAAAARRLKLPVRGVVENMSWFTGDDGKRYEIFGAGGGKRLAEELGAPLLAQIPLVRSLRKGGDSGLPVTVSDPDDEASVAFAELAGRVESMGPARLYRQELTVR